MKEKYPDVVWRRRNHADDFGGRSLADCFLVDKVVPGDTGVTSVHIYVLALLDAWAVYGVSDAPVCFPKNVFRLHRRNVASVAGWVTMWRLLLHELLNLKRFRHVSFRLNPLNTQEKQTQSPSVLLTKFLMRFTLCSQEPCRKGESFGALAGLLGN